MLKFVCWTGYYRPGDGPGSWGQCPGSKGSTVVLTSCAFEINCWSPTFIIEINVLKLIRRWGPIDRPTSSPCTRLWHLAKNRKKYQMLFCLGLLLWEKLMIFAIQFASSFKFSQKFGFCFKCTITCLHLPTCQN